jgi:DNA-binding MarR family transcriptional regulator
VWGRRPEILTKLFVAEINLVAFVQHLCYKAAMNTQADIEVLNKIRAGLGVLFRTDTRRGLTQLWNDIAGLDNDMQVYIILSALEHQGAMRMSDLADATGLAKTYMSRLVRRLLEADLVQYGEPSADRRELILQISRNGRQVLDAWRMAARQTLVKFLADWSDEDRRAFAELLARFTDTMGKAISEQPGWAVKS